MSYWSQTKETKGSSNWYVAEFFKRFAYHEGAHFKKTPKEIKNNSRIFQEICTPTEGALLKCQLYKTRVCVVTTKIRTHGLEPWPVTVLLFVILYRGEIKPRKMGKIKTITIDQPQLAVEMINKTKKKKKKPRAR